MVAPTVKMLRDEPRHRHRFKEATVSHTRRREPRRHDPLSRETEAILPIGLAVGAP